MPTTMCVPLPALSPEFIRLLQEKYGQAEVELNIRPGAAPEVPFSEDQFWQLVGLLDWGRNRNADILAPAAAWLSQFSEADIRRFDDLLAEKLFALDGANFAAAATDTDHFSVDGFLYDRCGVVASGKRFFEKVLKKPDSMPQNSGFEPILYLAAQAHRLKTGTDEYDHLPAVSYETFSNATGWPGRPTLQELILAD